MCMPPSWNPLLPPAPCPPPLILLAICNPFSWRQGRSTPRGGDRGQGRGLGVNYDLLKPQTSRTTTNKATHTHTHLQRDYYNTYAPYNSFPHAPRSLFTVPSSLSPHVHRLLVVQHIHSFSFVSLRFVLFSFFFFFLCLSVFLAFLRVSGLRSPFLRFSQQFLLYDFILSSFYTFFMLDLAVFSLCWPTNPPMAVPSPQEQRSQFLVLSSSRVPDAKTQFSTVHFWLVCLRPSLSLSLSVSVSLPPFEQMNYHPPSALQFSLCCCLLSTKFLLFMHYLVETTIIGC